MSFKSETLKKIVGKAIAGIILQKNTGAGPRSQLFLIFTDNTYMEFYGDINWLSDLESGDVESVKQPADRFEGRVEVIT